MSNAVSHLPAIAFGLIFIKLKDKIQTFTNARQLILGFEVSSLDYLLVKIQTGERAGFHFITAEFSSDFSPIQQVKFPKPFILCWILPLSSAKCGVFPQQNSSSIGMFCIYLIGSIPLSLLSDTSQTLYSNVRA